MSVWDDLRRFGSALLVREDLRWLEMTASVQDDCVSRSFEMTASVWDDYVSPGRRYMSKGWHRVRNPEEKILKKRVLIHSWGYIEKLDGYKKPLDLAI